MRLLEFLLVGILILAPHPPSLGEDPVATDPVPLHTPLPETPVATVGTGLTPLVEVELVLDERGIVHEARVLSIEPKSEFDDLFKQAAIEEMRGWRFAPARQADKAVATTVSWKVRFPERVASPLRRRKIQLDFERAQDPYFRQRREILELPYKQLRQLQARNATKAKGLLDTEKTVFGENEYFGVYMDVGTEEAARGIANNLAAAWAASYKVFNQQIPSLPARGKVLVFIYRSADQYRTLVQIVGGLEASVGFYDSSGIIAFHVERITPEALLSTLIHEATHALMDRHLFAIRAQQPRWLGEGFAEYMGCSDIRKGKLIPGGHKQRITGWRLAGNYPLAYKTDTSSRANTKAVKQAVKEKRALSIVELVDASPRDFYGEKIALFYPQSWMLVHFLRHGESDWAEELFPRFMLLVAEGYPVRDVFQHVYGAPPEALEDAYRNYIMSF